MNITLKFQKQCKTFNAECVSLFSAHIVIWKEIHPLKAVHLLNAYLPTENVRMSVSGKNNENDDSDVNLCRAK